MLFSKMIFRVSPGSSLQRNGASWSVKHGFSQPEAFGGLNGHRVKSARTKQIVTVAIFAGCPIQGLLAMRLVVPKDALGFQAWRDESSIGFLQAELEEPVWSCVRFFHAERVPCDEATGFSSHGPLSKSR